MKQNKILIIVTNLLLGGIQNYVRALTKLLLENNDVFIIAINEADKQDLTNVYSLKYLKSYQKPLFIKKFIKEYEIDIILDHRTKSNILKLKVYDFLLKNIPKIQFIHSANLSLYFFKNSILNQFVYKNTHTFVSVSEYINELVQKQVKGEFSVAYHFFDEKNKQQDVEFYLKKDILFIGRFDDEVKDLSFLLNAYLQSQLYKQNIHFTFLGSGEDEMLISNFARQNKIDDFIHIHQPVIETQSYYKSARVVVLASNFEGLPLVLLEALHHNTPVVTTPYNPSVYEIVKNDINGIIVEKNITEFSEALKKMCLNHKYYKNLLLNNTEMLPYKFTIENAKINWENIVNDLLKNRTT